MLFLKPNIVAFVPIKLNSERLPRKNILALGEHALCYYIFQTLLKVNGIDEIYVYCSDEKIMQYIPEKIKFKKRSKSLDTNFTKGLDIYNAFAKDVPSDIYVLAHATSPFIKAESIQDALSKVINGDYDSAMSVEKIQTFTWYKNKPLNYGLDDIPRTQDIEPVYIETSGFFIFKNHVLQKYGSRIGKNPYLKQVTKIEAIDIDTKDDFELAKIIAKCL